MCISTFRSSETYIEDNFEMFVYFLLLAIQKKRNLFRLIIDTHFFTLKNLFSKVFFCHVSLCLLYFSFEMCSYEVIFILLNYIQKITEDNKLAMRKIVCANGFTNYLINTLPVYHFVLNQMKLLSLKFNQPPLSVKIQLAAKWSQAFIGINDSQISRQLLILEFTGILKLVSSSLVGRFGKFVNTYQVVLLPPIIQLIKSRTERIKAYYDNKSPLAFIRRDDFTKF